MKLFELYGGPGAGKSTAAAALFVALKNKGVRANLVGEAATELILNDQGVICQDNQYLVGAMQWERILRLSRHECDVAISDCPIILGQLYSKGLPYYNDQFNLIRKLEVQFETYKVYVRRCTPYDQIGRFQTAAEAEALDPEGYLLGMPYWLEIHGDSEGQQLLCQAAIRELGL
jgi:tRNA uridine 5-carbamoylmethylation protein Kti12